MLAVFRMGAVFRVVAAVVLRRLAALFVWLLRRLLCLLLQRNKYGVQEVKNHHLFRNFTCLLLPNNKNEQIRNNHTGE